MKIGLVTIYTVPNYGSVLQAFATQKVLELLGCECKIIDYEFPNEWHYQHGFIRVRKWKLLLHTFGIKANHRKEKKLNKFKSTNYNLTLHYSGYNDLINEDWKSFDAFVVGSDQVWNTRFLKGDMTFLLSFVPESIPRYSIASSFALKQLPKQYEKQYANELSKFSAISVREKNGADIIENQLRLDKNVFVCLDPTLCLTKEQWRDFIPCSKFKKKRPYILLYMLTYAFEPRPYIFEVIKYFQKKDNCDVIALEGYTSVKNAMGLCIENAEDSSIPEFIDLFSNADLVITSSFHGTAFAINFSRPLVSIVPDNNGDDRQTSLLQSVQAEHCIVNIGQKVETINPYYVEERVQQNLCQIRTECLDWIARNICRCNKQN